MALGWFLGSPKVSLVGAAAELCWSCRRAGPGVQQRQIATIWPGYTGLRGQFYGKLSDCGSQAQKIHKAKENHSKPMVWDPGNSLDS